MQKDFRYGISKRLVLNAYLFTEEDEKGIVHYFFSKEELLSYLGQFEVLSLKDKPVPVERGSRAQFHLKLRNH